MEGSLPVNGQFDRNDGFVQGRANGSRLALLSGLTGTRTDSAWS
jgi:hypothetical protein